MAAWVRGSASSTRAGQRGPARRVRLSSAERCRQGSARFGGEAETVPLPGYREKWEVGIRPAVLSTDGGSTEKLGTGSPGLSVHEGTAGAS